MQLNANFNEQVIVHSEQLEWLDSPMQGVQRRMLDRLGDEVARATTIVRYAPGSHFSPHVHTGGEEFLVLEGVFQDEHGDFPAGSYIRNPPESRHTPGSEPGCVIFVKLWQFELSDRVQVRSHLDSLTAADDPQRPGIRVTPLHKDARENVQIEQWTPGTRATIDAAEGAELLMLQGEALQTTGEAQQTTGEAQQTTGNAQSQKQTLKKYSWMRLPLGSQAPLVAGSEGATFWIKTGHLRFVKAPAT